MTLARSKFLAAVAVVAAPLIVAVIGFGPAAHASTPPPVVLYTDILSGPNTGGEDGKGTYLSIFGKNFGSSRGDSKVYVNNVEVGAYKYWGPSRGRPDVQQITVQLGPSVTSGAIRVVVGGQPSNTDHSFTVRPGDIYFVARNGDDDTAVIGDITKPFFDANDVVYRSDFGAGDTMVVRGGLYTEDNSYQAWITIKDKHGTQADPIMMLGYPGEDPIVKGQDRTLMHLYSPGGGTMGGVVLSGFVRQDGQLSGFRKGDEHIAIINNDTSGQHGSGGGSAAITGGGSFLRILGNSVHDNGDTKLYHGIYIDNDGQEGRTVTNLDIAFNHVWDQAGGRGIQIYWSEDNPAIFFNVTIHDNLIHDIDLHGITLSKGSAAGCKVYNNVLYNTGRGSGEGTKGGIQTRGYAAEVEIYNNTVYDVPHGAAFDNQYATSVVIRNNIFALKSGQDYFTDDGGEWDDKITATNNVYFGGSQGLPSWESNAITADPLFVSAAGADFHLQAGSSAINAGVAIAGRDHDGVMRPQGGGYDCGAYEAGSTAPPTEPPDPPDAPPTPF